MCLAATLRSDMDVEILREGLELLSRRVACRIDVDEHFEPGFARLQGEQIAGLLFDDVLFVVRAHANREGQRRGLESRPAVVLALEPQQRERIADEGMQREP